MKNFFLAIACALTLPLYSDPAFQDLEDTSNLPFLCPDLATRKTAKIRLANGLEVYLISDEKADQSAAAMAVQAGSWNDPPEYPGMAHFCEHMLFKGSQKFQNEAEFFTLVADHNGQTNAFTAPDRTVYMFSSNEEGFSAILDHFSRFFIDPLFNTSGIEREMHAVDEEFAKNIENDDWREYMVFKETGNPNHPNAQFSIGNSETLSKIPPGALKKWHSQYYAAGKMHLVIYSPLSIEALKELVRTDFSLVPAHDTPAYDDLTPLASDKQLGHLICVEPIRQKQILTLEWELPRAIALDPGKSAQLLSYALSRGQPFNLNECLKREGLADEADIGIDEIGPSHRYFEIRIELTDKGLEEIDVAILRCFQAISGLKNSGLPLYLLEEMNAVAKLNYQFQMRKDAFQYVASIAQSLPDEPLASYPKEKLLSSGYSEDKIAELEQFLTPENCIFILQAPAERQEITLDQKEHWVGAEYAIRAIKEDLLEKWQKAQPHPDIRLAGPNPFIPTHFDIVARSSDPETSVPRKIADDEHGIAYYSRALEFTAPESVFFLHILTPEINASARSHCLAALYIKCLTDRLHPTLMAANSAGLRASFDVEKNRIECKIAGFSEKAHLLFEEILKQLAAPPPTPDQFASDKNQLLKELSNMTKELAVLQAKERMASLIEQDRPTKLEELAALEIITYDDFCRFLHALYDKVYLQAMFCGNLLQSDAESAWTGTRHLLGGAPYPKADHPVKKILALPENAGPYAIHEKGDVLGNAAFLAVDLGPFTFERRAAQEILSAALKESFFDTLRSRQKTGYIAQAEPQEIERRLFQFFLVQSNSHQPEDLLSRFELFLESTLQDLEENIPESRFFTLKQSIAESLLTRYRSLNEKSAFWNLLAFDYDADFAWLEKRLAGFANLNYEAFKKEARGFFSKDNRKRLAILYEGRIRAPFFYETVAPSDITKIGGYLTRSDLIPPTESKSNEP